MLNSPLFAPPRTTEEMCSEDPPELVTVTVCGPAIVPCVTTPNDRFVDEREAAGLVGGAAVADPLTWIDWGEFWASSEIERIAERCPAASGVNVSVIIQEALAA